MRRAVFLFGLVAAGLLFSGQAAAEEARLILALGTDPKSFNPVIAQETSTTAVTGFLFEGLIRFDPVRQEIEGALAESWTVSEEGKVWTFHLRPQVRWFDGVAVTAEDVRFTFEDLLYNPDIVANSRDIFLIDGQPIQIRVIDKTTVAFHLPETFAPFLYALEQPILPKHALEQSVREKKFSSTWSTDTDPSQIIGTGPFRLAGYQPGERVRLVRNAHYWKRDAQGGVLPYLDEILILILPNPDVRLLKFMEGEIDIYSASGKDYPVLAPRAQEGGYSLYNVGPTMASNFLAFNQSSKDEIKRSWFRNPAFRRAVAYGLDRQAMIDIVFNGLGVVECSPLSPSAPFFYNTATPCYDYDPDKARRLLRHAGFEDRSGDGWIEDAAGHPVEFILFTNAENPERMAMASMVREDLARLGMKVHFLPLEFNSLVTKLVATGDWDLVLMGLTGSLDPHFGANVWRSEGTLHFWNKVPREELPPWQKRIDEIFRTAGRTLDQQKRKALYEEWQVIAAENLPLIYLVLPRVIYAVKDRLENVKPTVLGGVLHNIERIRVKEGA